MTLTTIFISLNLNSRKFLVVDRKILQFQHCAFFQLFVYNFFLGTPLGYNLAVNTAMHAAASAARPVQPSPNTSLTVPGQGNCQPGFPVRPSEANTITSNLLNSNNPAGVVRPGHNEAKKSEGHPGHIQRTDYSPDTTTKDLPPVQVSHQHHPTYLSQDQQNQQVNFNFTNIQFLEQNLNFSIFSVFRTNSRLF